ncbi:hypothetical protein [Nocardia sp. NPDC003963]
MTSIRFVISISVVADEFFLHNDDRTVSSKPTTDTHGAAKSKPARIGDNPGTGDPGIHDLRADPVRDGLEPSRTAYRNPCRSPISNAPVRESFPACRDTRPLRDDTYRAPAPACGSRRSAAARRSDRPTRTDTGSGSGY